MFKVGDRVWCMNYGWGDIIEFDCKDKTIEVEFKEGAVWFTADGRGIGEPYRILFFEEISIPKSALERPRKTAKEMLDECDEVEFEAYKDNWCIYINLEEDRVFEECFYNIFIHGIKYISQEDAKRIVKECRENNI